MARRLVRGGARIIAGNICKLQRKRHYSTLLPATMFGHLVDGIKPKITAHLLVYNKQMKNKGKIKDKTMPM